MNDDALARLREDVTAKVAAHGFTAIHVFPVEEATATFTYTVGLGQTFEHPDVIVYGLSHELGHNVLSSAVERIGEGVQLVPDERVAGIIKNFDMLVRLVPGSGKPLNLARFFPGYRGAVQLLWPDEAGVFPGEVGVDSECESAQRWDEADG